MKREITIIKSDVFEPSVRHIEDMLDLWFRSCSKGEWVLKLEKKKHQRGLSQNALLWVWMDVLSKEWADATDKHYTKEQFKEYFCRMFHPVDGPNGTVVGGSTSEMTVEQMTEFLNKIQVYAAAEWDIKLLGADDKMFEEWRAQYEA